MERYRWVDEIGNLLSTHHDLESAGRAHRRYCRGGIRCIRIADGLDVTEAAIVASIVW